MFNRRFAVLLYCERSSKVMDEKGGKETNVQKV
jgi:hypothetical protein